MQHFENAAALGASEGRPMPPSEWLEVTQTMIDDFAKATGDYQWIHVDTARAVREMPGGKTIAHGLLTLSLVGALSPHIFSVKAKRVLNVGSNKVRFLTPVPVGSRIRLMMTVKSSDQNSLGTRIHCEAAMEMEGCERPAMVAEVISLYID
jgi:acyl dehydratase